MSNVKSLERKRCTICRRWYHPSIKSFSLQKTCSETCRKIRRRRLARLRRERELQDYRVDERARQRVCRERKRKRGVEPPTSGNLSRTGLTPQRTDLRRVVRESVDMALGRSRTALIRQLTAFLKDSTPIPGQILAIPPHGHAPACAAKCLFFHG